MGSVDLRMMHVLIKPGAYGRWMDCSRQIVNWSFDGNTYALSYDDGRHEELLQIRCRSTIRSLISRMSSMTRFMSMEIYGHALRVCGK